MTIEFLTSSFSDPNIELPSDGSWIYPMKKLFMISVFEIWMMWQCFCYKMSCWECNLRFSLLDYPINNSHFHIHVFYWTTNVDGITIWISSQGQSLLFFDLSPFSNLNRLYRKQSTWKIVWLYLKFSQNFERSWWTNCFSSLKYWDEIFFLKLWIKLKLLIYKRKEITILLNHVRIVRLFMNTTVRFFV